MPSVKDTIAKNLAQLRKGARLTQQQLAEKLAEAGLLQKQQ